MRNTFNGIVSIFIITLIFAIGAVAQKAEPKEIKFAQGKTSAMQQGKLKAEQQAEYAIHGKAGQMLTLTFSSTVGKRAEVFVFSPSTSGESTSGNKTWDVEFTADGVININVTCSRTCNYSLKTTIK